MSLLIVFGIGLLFGTGLVVSGMTNPAVVLAFLDFGGAWDPALAFVMGGALAAAAPAYALARRRGRTLTGTPLGLPERHGITPGLIGGAALFGLGWGLSGFCPGPAIVAAATGHPTVLVFLAAMAGGVLLQRVLAPRLPSAHAAATTGAPADDGELRCG